MNSDSKLGPYRIVDRIGAGGMGVVYRARDERLERDVAIKVLPAGLLTDEAARRRFRTEALALAKLSHANIAAVYDVGEQDGVDYLVMECVPGQSLAHKLKLGPLAVKEALSLGVEIAAALEEAHEHGVVHRDLKPSNIMVTPKGHAKVLDFGLAKLLEPAGAEDVTVSHAETRGPVGTPLYMSPEQADGKVVDSRADLWSLGVVLYESLSGKSPFQGDSGFQILLAIAQETPKPLRELRPDVPASAEKVVSRALEKDPAKRYQSAAEISRDASEVLVQLSAPPPPPTARGVRVAPAYLMPAALLFVILAATGGWLYWRSERRHWAKEEAIPEIVKLKDADRSLAAFLLLEKAGKYLPGDPQIAVMGEENTRVVSISSSPAGATVEIQDYLSPESGWYRLGLTPLSKIRIPKGYFRWKVLKQGFGEDVTAPVTSDEMKFALDLAQAAPPGMVRVDGGPWGALIDFVGWIGSYDFFAYYMDRFEVTNRQYQEFVDKGGYEKREYWHERFPQNGRELSWDDAMKLFRDGTQRSGPSTWEGGHYPEGQGEYPVSGISWYEASAYAAFAGKSLPVLGQWFQAAPEEMARYIVPMSNMSRTGPAPVGSFHGLGPYGTYDMAGNVKEWTANAVGANLRFIVGGAWNSQTYLYQDPEALSPFDRAAGNGFRCVKNVAPVPAAAAAPVMTQDRDFTKVKPISDEVFHAYQAMYAYSETPLKAKVEGVTEDTRDWRVEKITFNTAYWGERMAAYLYLPKSVRPPYQTVVFFPSARVLGLTDSRQLGDVNFFDYVVESGRAVLYPIYQDTYERRIRGDVAGMSAESTEEGTQRFKDFARSIDYLETRTDIDKQKLAYLGVSMGSAEGVIYVTLEDRIRTAVFLDGGFFLQDQAPGRDQADFAPRLKRPVLMVNGKYDFSFSVDRAQDPLFRMLGTPDDDKRHVLLDTPHDVTAQRTELVKVVLEWLDKYLGRVE